MLGKKGSHCLQLTLTDYTKTYVRVYKISNSYSKIRNTNVLEVVYQAYYVQRTSEAEKRD